MTINNVHVGVCCCLNNICNLSNLQQGEILATGNVDEDILCSVYAGILQQGVVDGLGSRISGTIVTSANTNTHDCITLAFHGGTNIVKVQVNKTRLGDYIRNSLNTLTQYIVSLQEGLLYRSSSIHGFQKILVGNNDKGINLLVELSDSFFRIVNSNTTFKLKRLCYYAHRQGSQLLGNPCYNGSCTSTSTSTHSSSYKHHVGTLQCILDKILAFMGCSLSNRRLTTSTKSTSNLGTDTNGSVGL